MAEDQDLLLPVDAQIVAARARIAGNERKRLDVLRIAHVRDQDAEQRWRRVETAEIGNAVVDTQAVESRADLTARPPLAFGPRRALRNLEVALPKQLEIPGGRVFLELLERQIEGVDVGRNLYILDARREDLRRSRQRQREADRNSRAQCAPDPPSMHRLLRFVGGLSRDLHKWS